jgi:hypothetical protein
LSAEPDREHRESFDAVLNERNRLWAELQERASMEEEAAFWRSRVEDIERSRWWRLGKPFRLLRRLRDDAPGTLDAIAHDLRLRRRLK